MAVTGPIPFQQPQSWLEGMFQGAGNTSQLLNELMKRKYANQMQPYELALKQAQVEDIPYDREMKKRGLDIREQESAFRNALLPMQLQQLQMQIDPTKKFQYEQNLFQAFKDSIGRPGAAPGVPQQPMTEQNDNFPTMMSGGQIPQERLPPSVMTSGRPGAQEAVNEAMSQRMPQMNESQGGPMNNAPSNVRPSQYTPEERAFGRRLGFDLSEDPEQIAQRQIETAEVKEANKINLQEAKKIEDSARELVPYAISIQKLRNLITNNPNLTGPISGSLAWAKLKNSKEYGQLVSHQLNLLGAGAKKLSPRGGAVVTQIAQKGKVSEFNQPETNLGILDAMAETMRPEFELMKQSYEEKSRKQFPIKFEDYFAEPAQNEPSKPAGRVNAVPKGYESIISPDGTTHLIPSAEVPAALRAGGRRG